MKRSLILALAATSAALVAANVAVRLVGSSLAGWNSASPADERARAARQTGRLIAAEAAPAPTVPGSATLEATGGGWPNLFGPGRNSISGETGVLTEWAPQGPQRLWRVPIGTGYSSPIAVADRVIVFHRQNDEEIVACLAAETGTVIWQQRTPTTYECRLPPYSSGPYSTPVSDGRHVYTLGAEGRLQCLRLDDGQVVWSRALSDEYEVPEQLFAVGHSPLLLDGRLILNVGGTRGESGIVALDALSGETLWGATNHGASYAMPAAAVIHNQPYVFVLTDRGLVSLDPADGRVFWTIEFSSGNREAPAAVTPLVHGELVLVTVYQVGTLCLRIRPGGGYEELWRHRRSLESQFNPLVCIDGYVYGWHFSDRSLRCVELATGRRQWRYKSAVSRGTQIAVDGRLLLLGEHGELGSVEIDPSRLVEVSRSEKPLLEGPCYSAPALHKGLLYLRNEQELACFNLRAVRQGGGL